MKKLLPALLLALLLCACGGQVPETTAPAAVPEITEPAPTETTPPTTVLPTTVPPTTVPPTTVPPTTMPVLDESWFDDALFIGESRTMGLGAYSRPGEADFFCGQGLTVYGVLGVEAADLHFSEQSLRSLCAWNNYGKIYIHLGINELGGNLDSYVNQYQKVIDTLRELEPDACIILQSVLSLTDDYSKKPAFSRESVQAMNDCIRDLAEKNGLHFSDVNLVVADEEGYLIRELTFDGCHLYPESYKIWADFLLEEAPAIQLTITEEE